MSLKTKPNITQPDDFYQELIDLHRDLDDSKSGEVNAKLILLLANHIGDIGTLREAMAIAGAEVN